MQKIGKLRILATLSNYGVYRFRGFWERMGEVANGLMDVQLSRGFLVPQLDGLNRLISWILAACGDPSKNDNLYDKLHQLSVGL
eukprot:5411425-Amphidinium_carterae.2